ncbi:MAG: winged helix-turn-helix domain-containing protein [Pseudomonadota bacterium]
MSDANFQLNESFQIASVTIIPKRNAIIRGSTEVFLEPKVMAVFVALSENTGTVVSRERLLEQIWGVEFGSDQSLSRAISIIRRSLRDTFGVSNLIETVPKRGYRLTAGIEPPDGVDLHYPDHALKRMQRQPTSSPIASGGHNEGDSVTLVGDQYVEVEHNSPKEKKLDLILLATGRQKIGFVVFVACIIGLIAFAVSSPLVSTKHNPSSLLQSSIAVLPFEDFSEEGNKAYFTAGIADQIRITLNQLDGVRVIGRASSVFAANSGRDVRKISDDLGVAFLLEGAVRWEDNRALITAQLVDANEGTVLWSNAYDRTLTADDLFVIQRGIAEEVAVALSVALDLKLSIDDRWRLEGTGASSLAVYDKYLRARFGPDSLKHAEAVEVLREVVAEDPNYAAAWALLGIRIGSLQWEARSADEARAYFDEALQLTKRAVVIDPFLAEARSFHAGMLVGTKDYGASHQEHQRALELGGNTSTIMQYIRLLQRTGRIRTALPQAKEIGDLEPLSRFFDLEFELMRQSGRYSEAHTALGQMTEGDYSTFDTAFKRWLLEANRAPTSNLTTEYFVQARRLATVDVGPVFDAVLDHQDNLDLASVALRQHLKSTGVQYPDKLLHIALLAAWIGDPNLALDAMTEEIGWSTVRMVYLWEELFSDMRQLPEFKEFAQTNGLVAYWQEYGWADACAPVSETEFECS